MKLFNIILVLLLLFGCSSETSSIESTVAPIKNDSNHYTMINQRVESDFNDFVYQRVTKEEILAAIDNCRDLFENDNQDIKEYEVRYNNLIEVARKYSTAYSYTLIQYDTNKDDDFYEKEYEYYLSISPDISDKYLELDELYIASPYYEDLIEYYHGIEIFSEDIAKIDYDHELVNQLQTEINLQAKEASDLLSQEVLIDFGNGKENALDAIYAATTIEEWNEKVEAYYRYFYDQIGDDLIDLVKKRNQIAELKGYDNYAEMSLAEDGYIVEEVKEMAEDVLDNIKPVYDELNQNSIYPQEFKYGDNNINGVISDFSDGLTPEVSESNDFRIKYNYSNIGDNDAANAYATNLSGLNAPYLMVPESSTLNGVDTIIHEFGHFNDFYLNYPYSYMGLAKSTDLSEVSSQSFELFFMNDYDKYYDNGWQQEKYNIKSFITNSMLRASIITLSELELYTSDDLTLENIKAYYGDLALKFNNDNSPYAGLEFASIYHLYEAPIYYYNYISSANVAVQMYMESLDNSYDKYFEFIKYVDQETIGDACLRVGLISPYDENSWQEIGQWMLKRYQ